MNLGLLASSSGQPISIQWMCAWFRQEERGWQKVTQGGEQTKEQTWNSKKKAVNAYLVKLYSIKHSGWGNKTTKFPLCLKADLMI